MSEIDTKRLKLDADYWDGVHDAYVAYFKAPLNLICGIPRPTKQEWEGGLPPAGMECEIQHLGEYNNNWMPFRVTAVTNDFVVGYIRNDRESAVNHKDPYVQFRPLKSKQERQREELAHLIDENYGNSGSGIADAILSHYNLEPKP